MLSLYLSDHLYTKSEWSFSMCFVIAFFFQNQALLLEKLRQKKDVIALFMPNFFYFKHLFLRTMYVNNIILIDNYSQSGLEKYWALGHVIL